MSAFDAFVISASGLTAERLRMDVISNNIANVNTTKTVDGGPYQRQRVIFEPRGEKANMLFPAMFDKSKRIANFSGVKVTGVINDANPPKLMFDPGHPDANKEGYVAMPNVNIVKEMVDMISATRAYEANVTALNSAKSMAAKALEIGKA
ncbi:MAG TPA: flagellar basal body rod protein FlgC [Candidatus Goldiibacteriota bacterium]|nr:flagellar basal body rod protein FlgC [Candidatus Goldiibacteriota bacterium]HPN64872.1 flagellar basal body rod protein FlgC [Candidatus Goldiibacteriota bacterium]HRQ43931.1 flagellar basal body rod protein FlgC [Candidatus Goldiibacteriota bacterium]